MNGFLEIVIATIVMAVAVRFTHGMIKGKIQSALSGWIILFSGSAFSFLTYISHEPNFLQNALNSAGALSLLMCIIAILIWSPKKTRKFKPFEKWYLASVGCLFLLWVSEILSAFDANTLTQLVMAMGYFPIIHNLISQKENKEDYFVWSSVTIASLLAMLPAITNTDILAILYASRSLILSMVVIGLMIYYDKINKKLI